VVYYCHGFSNRQHKHPQAAGMARYFLMAAERNESLWFRILVQDPKTAVTPYGHQNQPNDHLLWFQCPGTHIERLDEMLNSRRFADERTKLGAPQHMLPSFRADGDQCMHVPARSVKPHDASVSPRRQSRCAPSYPIQSFHLIGMLVKFKSCM
jgi:hypothetical protein